jgi:CheY-like chemotaxis protein
MEDRMQNAVFAPAPRNNKEKRIVRTAGVRRARILIAEDDWAFRDMLVAVFEEDGYEVVAVGNGADLLHVLASSMLPRSGVKEFDIIVSDLRMPGWSGLPGLEKLGNNPMLPPIVAITAFGSEETRQRAEAAGIVAVLNKPFDLDELVALASTVITQPRR